MPAPVEEVVVGLDRRHAEDLGEQAGQDLFLGARLGKARPDGHAGTLAAPVVRGRAVEGVGDGDGQVRGRVQPADGQARGCAQLADGHIGCGDRGPEETGHLAAELLGRRTVEQVGTELDRAVQAAFRQFPERDGQVELRRARHAQPLHGDLGALQGEHRVGVVLQHQHDLEHRVPAQRPRRVHDLDRPVERDVLVGERGQVDRPYPAQQIAERRITGGAGTQHQGVDEEPDQVVQGFVGPAGHHRAQRDVGAGAEAREPGGQRRLDRHEQCRLLATGQPDQRRVLVRGHGEADDIGLDAGDGRPVGPGRQPQLHRQIGQRMPPELRLPDQPGTGIVLAAEDPVLPEHVVGVLHGQGGRRGPPAQPGRVGGRQVAGQRLGRPAVAGDVVHDQHEDGLVRVLDQQPCDKGQVGRQIETVCHRLGQHRAELARIDVDHVQRDMSALRRVDDLIRLAVRLGEGGAERLVPAQQVAESRLEGGPVEFPAYPQHERHVVRGVRAFHTVQEPEPPLGVGQGEAGRTGLAAHLRSCVRRLVEQYGDRGGRGDLEQRADRQLALERGADAVDQPGGEQRVATELEEALIGADRRQPEHVGEQSAQDLLPQVTRFAVPGGRGIVRSRKAPAVEFPAPRQRKLVQHHHRGGHHVVGHRPGHGGADPRRVHGHAALGDHIGDEPSITGAILPDHGERGGDAVLDGQRRFDLGRLDAEAAQFHLGVGSADEVQPPVRAKPHEIAGPVHTGAVRGEGVGHELFGGQTGAPEVAAGQAGTGDVQLAGHSREDRPQRGVEDVDPRVVERAADGDGGGQVIPVDRPVRGEGGGLGGAVAVDDLDLRAVVEDPAHRGGRHDVAARPDLTHPEKAGGRLFGQDGEQPGGEPEVGDAGPGDQAPVFQHVQVARWGDHEPAAVQQRRPDLVGRGVELLGRVDQDPGPLLRPETPVGRQIDDVAVGDDHAFGAAGGSGGVHDVRSAVRVGAGPSRCRRGRGRDIREIGDIGGIGQEGDDVGSVHDDPPDARRQGRRQGPYGDDELGCHVVEQERQPLGRVPRVERRVGGSRLEHRQHGLDQGRRARHHQPDHPLGPGSVPGEQRGQPVGPGVQLRVRHRTAVRGHRHGVGGQPCLCPEALVDEAGHPIGHGLVVRAQDEVQLLLGQDLKAAHGQLGRLGEGGQDPGETVGHGRGRGAVDQVGPAQQREHDARARAHVQSQGIVRALPYAWAGGREVGGGQVPRTAGLILEGQDGVEQGPGDVGEPLDGGQAEVAVPRGLRPVVAQRAQHVPQGEVRGEAHPDRNRVDQQADHAVRVREVGGATRDGGAEHHVVAAQRPPENERPRALEDGVQRHAHVARAVDERLTEALGEIPAQFLGLVRCGVSARRAQDAGDQSPLLQAVQGMPPRRFGRLRIGPVQPGQIVAVRGDRLGRVGRAVAREDLTQQQSAGPRVQDGVVRGQDEPVVPLPEPDQREAEQRRLLDGEPMRPVIVQKPRQAGVPVHAGQVGQVEVLPVKGEATRNHLYGFARAAVPEPGAQVRVPAEHGGGGRPQGRRVHVPVEVRRQLRDVQARGSAFVQRVEQESLLQR